MTTVTIVFIVLKLLGLITWSWLWVLSPLWIGMIALIVFNFAMYLYWEFKR